MDFHFCLITGPKHSGKSLCAKALKKITGGAVVDLDEEIEAQTGKTPRELYALGQEVFKKAEVQALASVLAQAPALALQSSEQIFEQESQRGQGLRIISAGGGLIDNGEAVALLAEARSAQVEIITVYLDIPVEAAWQRIAADGELPPFLGTTNPRETHRTLHCRRAEACKKMADIIVSAENKSPEEIAGEIAGCLF